MIQTSVKIDDSDLRDLLSKAQGQATGKAIARGMNQALSSGRAESNRQIRKRYNIPLFRLRSQGSTKSIPAKANNLRAELNAEARRSVKLASFKGLKGDGLTVRKTRNNGTTISKGRNKVAGISRPKPRQKVSIELIKGKRTTLDHAFIAKVGNHVGIFQRKKQGKAYAPSGAFNRRTKRINKTGTDSPIGSLYSFTLFKAMANKHSKKPVEKAMQDRAAKQIPYWLKQTLKA
jgi:hypothetical protein